jgi:hypothetical protein
MPHAPQPCGQRSLCWRSRCREHFGVYKTVETLKSGLTVAHCHRVAYPSDGMALKTDLKRHGALPE